MFFDAASTRRRALGDRPGSSSGVRVHLGEAQKFRDKLSALLELASASETQAVGVTTGVETVQTVESLPQQSTIGTADTASSIRLTVPNFDRRAASAGTRRTALIAKTSELEPRPISFSATIDPDPYPPLAIEAMRLEARRYDVEQELGAARAVKAALELRIVAAAAAAVDHVQAQAEAVADLHLATRHVDQQLAAEMDVYRAKRQQEKEMRQAGRGPLVEKYRPKYASAWSIVSNVSLEPYPRVEPSGRSTASAMGTGQRPASASSSLWSRFTPQVQKRPPQALPGKRLTPFSRRNYDDEEFPDEDTRVELLRIRTLETLRCCESLEPSARLAILTEESRRKSFLAAAETIQRSAWMARVQADYDEQCARVHLQQRITGAATKLQLTEWSPIMFSDRQYYQKRLKQETLPVEIGASLLREATERHRQAIRGQWEAIRELRADLLRTIEQRHTLRREVTRWSEEVDATEHLPTTNTRRISARQRLEYATFAVDANLQRETDIKRRLQQQTAETCCR
jgi:hypothetical protein